MEKAWLAHHPSSAEQERAVALPRATCSATQMSRAAAKALSQNRQNSPKLVFHMQQGFPPSPKTARPLPLFWQPLTDLLLCLSLDNLIVWSPMSVSADTQPEMLPHLECSLLSPSVCSQGTISWDMLSSQPSLWNQHLCSSSVFPQPRAPPGPALTSGVSVLSTRAAAPRKSPISIVKPGSPRKKNHGGQCFMTVFRMSCKGRHLSEEPGSPKAKGRSGGDSTWRFEEIPLGGSLVPHQSRCRFPQL